MKRCALFITTLALFSSAAVFQTTAQPPAPVLPPATEPGVIPPAPAPGGVPGAAAEPQNEGTTITISRTITNAPGAITIVGTASSEQEKQTIGAKVQEAAPGRTVNNQLVVAGQGIFEPSGAERPSDKSSKEKEDEDSTKSKDESETPDQTDHN